MATQSKTKSIGAYCIFLFVIVLVIQQIETSLTEQGAASGGPLANAGMYPYYIVILMALFLFLDVLDTWFLRAGNNAKTVFTDERFSTWSKIITVLSVVSLTVIYQYFLSSAGYLLLTPFYLFLLFKALHAGTVARCLLGSIGITAALYVVFQEFLNVVLPTGLYQPVW
ncbi:tripartite tricarboxylate transporter TctB family protein [Vibrio mimicus]|uniref:tripartite tricarboxylate transporter TctB family protein n=1 Tax=Vibrio mimicus TaxID=674 RepID=UPI0011D90BC8|nr:tripartite tricarboxylate transporter TctB family protein [Vibrio mimicus]TXY47073.1 tripartite tricarboxylate transporter TctB family protein [Vibrio mimicus]TXZ77268.1 tripartite tricarboxylate transporter TctB family protein [Vibrio mimicus]